VVRQRQQLRPAAPAVGADGRGELFGGAVAGAVLHADDPAGRQAGGLVPQRAQAVHRQRRRPVVDDDHPDPAPGPPPRMNTTDAVAVPPPVEVWGLPLAPVTLARALDLVARFIAARTPRYLVTANVHYAMLAESDPRLTAVNRGAALVLADGMPLVWASRGRLPERVTGSDLVPALCGRAAERGHRVFFLGAAPGVAAQAAANLQTRHPGLNAVGTLAPPFRELTAAELAGLTA